MTKMCTKCKIVKNCSEFTVTTKKYSDGFAYRCKSCISEYSKYYWKRKTAGRPPRAKQSAEERGLRRRMWQAGDRKRHPEKYAERKRKYKDKAQAGNTKYARERRARDPNFRMIINLRNRVKNALRGYLQGTQKAGSVTNDLGCSLNELKLHIESQFQPGMTWENYGNKIGLWSLDHIIPLSAVNLTDRAQFLQVSHFSNLQPMWHVENIKKGNKLPQGMIYPAEGSSCIKNSNKKALTTHFTS